MSATPRQPVVLDATVLSNFASTGTVDVLVDILDRPATVPAVQTELERGYARDTDFLDDPLARIGDAITLLGVEEQSTGDAGIRDRLDSGEAEALLGAIAREGTLATDDLAAREMATERSVPVTGLVVGIRRGEIDIGTANGWLDDWRAKRGYYPPVERIEEVLG